MPTYAHVLYLCKILDILRGISTCMRRIFPVKYAVAFLFLAFICRSHSDFLLFNFFTFCFCFPAGGYSCVALTLISFLDFPISSHPSAAAAALSFQVVVTPHRHGGVFIARGKEDALVTKNLVPGVSVYGEKRISVEVRENLLHFLY